MKTLTNRQMAAVKRVAQNVSSAIARRDKLKVKMQELYCELEECQNEIDAHNSGIKAITGYNSEDLIRRVIVPTTDKNGNTVKITKYEPNENVIYNEVTKFWEIHELTLSNSDEVTIDEGATAPEREEIPAEGFNPINYNFNNDEQ